MRVGGVRRELHGAIEVGEHRGGIGVEAVLAVQARALFVARGIIRRNHDDLLDVREGVGDLIQLLVSLRAAQQRADVARLDLQGRGEGVGGELVAARGQLGFALGQGFVE